MFNTIKEESYQLIIKNQLEDILLVAAWLQDTFKKHEVAKKLLFKFDICASEAVTNIISYAYPVDSEHEIVLNLAIEPSQITLQIIDSGVPFNPLDRPDHVHPKDIDRMQVGGLGIYLIQHYMDTCSYLRNADKNILTIQFDCQ